ncbi:MAG: membrane-bound metallopeptidase [Bacteroidetes bacterium]|nr:MAG: membrane-bound metallopeptidase [Bacteroidota bacterium]
MTVSLFRSNKKVKRLIALFLVLCLLPAEPVMLFAQKGSPKGDKKGKTDKGGDKNDRKSLETKKKSLKEDIAAMDKEIKKTRKDKTLTMNQLFTLNKKLEAREELIKTISAELNMLNGQIAENNVAVKSLQLDVDRMKKEYARMIVYAYRNRDAYNRLVFIFAAADFNQAYNRVKYIRQVTESRRQQAEKLAQQQNVLKEQLAALEQQKADKQMLLGAEELEKLELANEKTDKEKMFVGLQSKEQELKAEIERKKKETIQIDKTIADLVAAEMARMERERKEREKKAAAAKEKNKPKNGTASDNKTTNNTTPPDNKTTAPKPAVELTPEAQIISDNFEGNRGSLPWPVQQGRISLGYGRHPHPVLEKVEINNNGVDITTSRDAYARSVFEGEVTGISDIPGVGKIVIVRHGQYLSMYVRLSEVYVKVGDKVKTKQNIGKVGYNDDEEASILHLEIWKSGAGKLNPQDWLARNS